MPDTPATERVLFVHAHPDDETISTGATIAALIARGSVVTVLTCTRGELGEVIPADIRHLEGSPMLAAHRARELAAAMGILGVTDHRFLGAAGARWDNGEPRAYTDSGMQWGVFGAEPTVRIAPDSLCAAEFGEVAADIAVVIQNTEPTAVISYDANGGYGHPDHVRAHEATRRAAEVMNVPFFTIDSAGDIVVDGSAVVDRKKAALAAYRSQVTVDGDTFALSSGPAHQIEARERFSRMWEETARSPRWKDQGIAVRILAWILALVVGAAVGGITTVEHQFAVAVLGVHVPVGIILTLLIACALFIGARIVFEGRLVGWLCAIGMIGAIGLLSLPGSGGGVLVPANPAGYLLTYGTAGIAIVTLASPAFGRLRRDKLGRTVEPKGTSSS